MSGGEFAEIGHGFAMGGGIIPNKTCGGIGQRVAAGHTTAASGVAAGPAGKFAFEIVGGDAAVHPIMPVRTQEGTAIGVVQEGEIANEFMFVGSDAFPENA